MFGPFVGGYLVDLVGRRPVMVVAVAMGLMSWAVLYHAETVWELCVARVVAGVGGGIIFTTVPLYLAEIAQDEVRSALVSLFNVFFTAGLLLEYLVGPYVSYWSLVWVSCVAPVIFFICSPWIPESPYFHLQHHYDQKAYNNLTWLRKGASDEQIAEELRKIKESLEEARNNKGSVMDLFSRKGNRNALLLSCGCIMFQQLSGINVMLFYSQTIFQLAGQFSLDPSESSALVGVILLLAACAAVPFTHVFGLKIMLLVSSLGMSFFLHNISDSISLAHLTLLKGTITGSNGAVLFPA
ncbi:hypothetical protein J6590_108654 [Homalodisca vitripennis]|nr:hypothetical protein J6590_108654 [Homalodisca vitripennis]